MNFNEKRKLSYISILRLCRLACYISTKCLTPGPINSLSYLELRFLLGVPGAISYSEDAKIDPSPNDDRGAISVLDLFKRFILKDFAHIFR